MEPLDGLFVERASRVLRERSWPAHQQLESTAAARLLLSDDLTLSRYAPILQRWHLCWSRLEAHAEAYAPAHAPANVRPIRRAHHAERDLAYLGYKPLNAASDIVMPALPDAYGHRWFGVAYVMQGSALGGQVIATHLQRLLGLRAGLGGSFFGCGLEAMGSGASASLRQRWDEWLRWLDQELTSSAAQDQAAEAAVATFTFIHTLFAHFPNDQEGKTKP